MSAVPKLLGPGVPVSGGRGVQWPFRLATGQSFEDFAKAAGAIKGGLDSATRYGRPSNGAFGFLGGVQAIDIQPNPKAPGEGTFAVYARDPWRETMLWRPHYVRDVSEPVTLGYKRNMNPWRLPLITSRGCERILIAGQSGSGKSVMARPLCLPYFAHPCVAFVLLDYKMVDLTTWRARASAYATEPERGHELFVKLDAEYSRRMRWCAENGKSMIGPHDLTPERPLIVVVCDEFQDHIIGPGGKTDKARAAMVERAAKKWRAAGMVLVISTQYPEVRVVPPEIKTQMSVHVCMKVSRHIDAKVIMGTMPDENAGEAPWSPHWGIGWCMYDIQTKGLEGVGEVSAAKGVYVPKEEDENGQVVEDWCGDAAEATAHLAPVLEFLSANRRGSRGRKAPTAKSAVGKAAEFLGILTDTPTEVLIDDETEAAEAIVVAESMAADGHADERQVAEAAEALADYHAGQGDADGHAA